MGVLWRKYSEERGEGNCSSVDDQRHVLMTQRHLPATAEGLQEPGPKAEMLPTGAATCALIARYSGRTEATDTELSQPLFHSRTMRLREVKEYIQGHIAANQQPIWVSKPGLWSFLTSAWLSSYEISRPVTMICVNGLLPHCLHSQSLKCHLVVSERVACAAVRCSGANCALLMGLLCSFVPTEQPCSSPALVSRHLFGILVGISGWLSPPRPFLPLSPLGAVPSPCHGLSFSMSF